VEGNSPPPILRPLEGPTFKFECHPQIGCFNRCCAALRLILTPYDLLRMKNRLGISSGAFLDTYGEVVLEKGSRFPLVLLKMSEEAGKRCPFVSPAGCSLYKDRPSSCRLYPLGRAARKVYSEKDGREKYFLVREKHCMGFLEEREWTVDEWITGEGLAEYNTMNDLWLEILSFPRNMGGTERELQQKIQMFFMGSYNLDRFRSFVLEGPFRKRFAVKEVLLGALAADDVALLRFSFEWLKFSLYGEKPVWL
jgi:uncharacterized protein